MTSSTLLLLVFATALLPLLGLASWLWHHYYHAERQNTAQRVVKNTMVPGIVRLLSRAIDTAFALILYRLVPAEAIGQYDLAALLVVQFLGTFVDFGLGTLLTREVSRRPADAARYYSVTLLLRWGLTLLSLPATLLLISAYSGLAVLLPGARTLTDDGISIILILLLTLLPASFNSVVTALFNAREQMEVPAAVELSTAAIGLLLRVGVLLAGWSAIGLAWAAVVSTTVTAFVFLAILVRERFPLSLGSDGVLTRGLLKKSYPLMLNSLLASAAFSFDVFILRAFADDSAVAQYRMPYRVLSVLLILTPLVTGAIFPVIARYAEGNREAFGRAYRVTLSLLLMAACPITVGITVMAGEIVQIIVGEQQALSFIGVSDIALGILIWFLPLSYVNGVTQYVLIALDQQAWITRSFVLMVVFNTTANFLLIPRFGINGACVTTILSEVVLYLSFLPLLRRESLSQPILTLALRPAVAALLMGTWLLFARQYGFWICAVTAPPAYLAALWVLGSFGVEERALAKRVLQRV